MRSLNRHQRGSTNWPFVIVLIALLAFVYLWWSAQENDDSQKNAIAEQKQSIEALRKIANAFGGRLKETADVVGFKQVVAGDKARGVDDTTGVDLARLKPNLDAAGMVTQGDAQVPGAMKELIDNAFLQYERKRRTGDPKAEAKDYKYATMSDELKAKLREIGDFEVPAAPIMDFDPDDADAKRKHEEAQQAYEQALGTLHRMFEEASQMQGFQEWAQTITRYEIGDPDQEDTIRIAFLGPLAEQTVEEFLNSVRGVPGAMRGEFESNKQADVAEIVRLAAQLTTKEGTITELNTNLRDAQDQFVTDLTAKDNQIGQLQQQVSDANLAKQTAENALAAEKGGRAKDVAKLNAELDARKEALRILKQKRDLVIRRDDKDGEIVASNNALRTASINLGFNDKVYVGQRFSVSALNRVGDRISKGTVMVTKVTGRKSARVRIVAMTAPITQGDFIHNPFYSPGETINVFFAGPITKWPADMAKQRLAGMNVNLQSGIDGHTDYIVIPNAWVVAEQAKLAGEDEDGGDDEGAVGAKSPIEIMQAHARQVGAEVITERLFDAFLSY